MITSVITSPMLHEVLLSSQVVQQASFHYGVLCSKYKHWNVITIPHFMQSNTARKIMQSDLKVSSKPPLAASHALLNKRHSLNAVEPLKRRDHLTRRGSYDLTRKEASNSCGNLKLLDSKSRSASLAQLKTSGRTLSASNLAALSDSNLSIQVALPKRSYEYTGSQSNLAKQSFEVDVKRYYEQLTAGCGNANCWNKFCASNDSSIKLNSRLASFVSIELATLGKQYFCKEIPEKGGGQLTNLSLLTANNNEKPVPVDEHKPGLLTNDLVPDSLANNDVKPGSLGNKQKQESFLQKFFSCSPFRFLFSNETILKPNKKKRSGSLQDLRKTQTLSGSEGSLQLNRSKIHGQLGEKQPSLTLNLHVNNNKTASDSSEKGVMGDKIPSPTLLDLQNEIECLDVDGTSLEEFEDQCVLEMSTSNLKELSLTHLTLSMLEISVKNYQQCGDASFIVNTIRTVFSSPEALNSSFKIPSSFGQSNSFKDNIGTFQTTSTNKQCRLDIIAVRNAYKLLLSLEPKQTFLHPLKNSAEIHLKTLQTCKVQPSEISQMFILLENPLVLAHNDLLQKLCDVLSNLETNVRDCFVEILTEYDSSNFQRVLKVCLMYITANIRY